MKKHTYEGKTLCTVDIGNTRIKIGFFKEDELIGIQSVNNEKALIEVLSETKFHEIIISNVGNKNITDLEKFNPIIFDHTTNIPIDNNYTTPSTLGIDRLAAAIGGRKIIGDKNILIIDAGTCITYDFLNDKSMYFGGGISPGIRMKYKALHNFTSKLPLIEAVDKIDLIGKSTEQSIMSGVINGTISEISGIIERYKNISDNFALVFCGGDAGFLMSEMDHKAIYEENLVLIGLNEVLKFNE